MADAPKPAVQNPLEMCQGPSGIIYIMAFMFLFLIMFNRSLGDYISSLIGVVLYPVIGFGGKWPLLTMMCAGLITITVSTALRHFTIDWVDLAKKQKLMGDFNKQLRALQKSGDKAKVEKLQSENQDIMGMQSSMMMQQMKSSVLSMVLAILIFRWLYTFIWSVPQPTATVPWDMNYLLTGAALGEICGPICMNPAGGGIPYWILLYIPMTIPLGQGLVRGLKYFKFSRILKEKGEDVFGQEKPKEAKLPPGEKNDHSGPKKKKDKSQREKDIEKRKET